MKKTRFVLFAFMVVAMLVVTACGSASETAGAEEGSVVVPDILVKSGKLNYGTAATFAPFEYMVDNEYTGFDIEFGAAIAEQLGVEPEINDMNFDGLIPALNGGRVDIINSAMYINEKRAAEVDFVPYILVGNSILVPKGNELGIETMDDLSGLTVAVTRGAIQEVYVQEQNKAFEEEGKDLIEILALPTANDSVLATEQGRADAFLNSSAGAAYLQEQKPGVFDIAGTFSADTEVGIAVKKGNDEVKEAITEAVNNLVEDGTYEELLEKYHMPEEMNYFK